MPILGVADIYCLSNYNRELVTKRRAKRNGAPTGIRTPDPLIKSQPLYQLSYRRT